MQQTNTSTLQKPQRQNGLRKQIPHPFPRKTISLASSHADYFSPVPMIAWLNFGRFGFKQFWVLESFEIMASERFPIRDVSVSLSTVHELSWSPPPPNCF